MNILADVQEIFREVFDDASIVINRETTSYDIEDWDSLAHIHLTVALEQHFKIKIALGESQTLKNVGEMIDLIEEKYNAQSK